MRAAQTNIATIIACLLMAGGLPGCEGQGPAPGPTTEGWRVEGPSGEQHTITVQDGWSQLQLPAEGKATQVCHPLDIQGKGRSRLDWRWSIESQAPDTAVIQLLASYMESGGGPLRGPGGQQRLLTLRGKDAAASQQHTQALLTSPPNAASARLCLQLRGQPGAALRLGEPQLEPIEPTGQPEPPNLLLVVVDALRADALGLYGAPAGSTPELDRFSERALVFERAWTQYTWTGPSFISYMSSRWARSHGWVSSWADRSTVRPQPGSELPTLPGVLRDAGYVTVGLNANGYLDWLDASQLGFDQWSFEGDTPAVNAALRELSHWSDDGRPNFLYLHLMATHHPLCPSPAAQARTGVQIDPGLYRGRDNKCPQGGLGQIASEYAGQGLDEAQHLAIYRDAYRAAVFDADRHLGQILATLDERGLRDNTVVVFASDHGELLGEHDHNGHGPWVWEPLARVPLLMAGPGIHPGRRDQGVARLIDLAPTMLHVLGLRDQTPSSWQGRSLLEPSDTPTLAVTERETWVAYTIDGQHKRIDHAETGEAAGLFDLHADPGELSTLEAHAAPAHQELERFSRAWMKETPVRRAEGEEAGVELEEVLRGLGYVE